MCGGAKQYQSKYPQRNQGGDDMGIKPFDEGNRNSKETIPDSILEDRDKFAEFFAPYLTEFRQKVEDILGIVPEKAPYYFVSGVKGYDRTVEKSIGSCYEKGFTNLNDAMRENEDYVRGAITYTDLNLLKEHVEKIMKEGEAKGLKVYRLKNKLKSDIANIHINLSLKNITTEIQFLYYSDPSHLPI